jgi:MOSC domain-containing protein YiiM
MHRTMADLQAGLPDILDAPKDGGRLEAIVARPARGARRMLEAAGLSLAGGLEGDRWALGCWKSTEDGLPHPDVQICIMNARVIGAIAGPEPAAWAPAGDNLFLDMDLAPENLPPGTRLALGGAELEITAVPHNGCDQFIARYGRDACVFVNTGAGKANRLRGIYARVARDGRVAVGDRAVKLG